DRRTGSPTAVAALLLVVDGGAGELFAVSAGAVEYSCACFAVRGDGDFSVDIDLVALLVLESYGVGVHLLVGAHVGVGVAGNGVLLAIEFAGPLAVGWFAVGAGAVNGDLDAVARGFVDDCGVVWAVRTDL